MLQFYIVSNLPAAGAAKEAASSVQEAAKSAGHTSSSDAICIFLHDSHMTSSAILSSMLAYDYGCDSFLLPARLSLKLLPFRYNEATDLSVEQDDFR